MNLSFSRRVLSELVRLGVRDFCLCAGSRNSPLMAVLLNASPEIRIFHFFDERSAAFFALGLIKKEGRPAAVVTTSGTAVAELLAATIEAHYSALPLVLITADRPKCFRQSGAPQAIEQSQIFSGYVEHALDLDLNDRFAGLGAWSRLRPVHLNLCFAEPLINETGSLFSEKPLEWRRPDVAATELNSKVKAFFNQCQRPLVILSSLDSNAAQKLKPYLLKWQLPIYAEGASQLRQDADLNALILKSGERILKAGHFDGVLRLGGVPQLRFWRDLEANSWPVLSIDYRPFSGLVRASEFINADLVSCAAELSESPKPADFKNLFALDAQLSEAKLKLFAEEPCSEPALFHALSRVIPDGSNIFLGNSLPVREWDLAATFREKNWAIYSSRGANGIDGQLSTFLGLRSSCFSDWTQPHWGIFGDLTALYDLSAPWVLRQIEDAVMTLVVMNNFGGKIFSRLHYLREHIGPELREKVFENSHRLNFEAWARMWNLGYERWEKIPHQGVGAAQSIVEIVPDDESTQRFWLAYAKLFES